MLSLTECERYGVRGSIASSVVLGHSAGLRIWVQKCDPLFQNYGNPALSSSKSWRNSKEHFFFFQNLPGLGKVLENVLTF